MGQDGLMVGPCSSPFLDFSEQVTKYRCFSFVAFLFLSVSAVLLVPLGVEAMPLYCRPRNVEELEPIPRLCQYILAVYEDDLVNPIWAPPGGYGIKLEWMILRKDYEETLGWAPPYLIYLDHDNDGIVLAIRGLNLAKKSDYAMLFDNKLGQTIWRSATWVSDVECDVLRELVERYKTYTLTFGGHSLGAAVVTLLAMLAVQNRHKLGNIERKRIRCYAMAPARCVSLNLPVRYADVINSVVRQKMLRDPRRLYAPGRLYHIVVRKPFRIGRYPPVVRTAVPVDGRFETIYHAIVWIERDSQRALNLMLERDRVMDIPPKQKMLRQQSVAREHSKEYKAALQRAVALEISQAYSPSTYGTFYDLEEGVNSSRLECRCITSFIQEERKLG
ncbi:Fungal lipase-like domain [Dillenia turbinata]|uniref:Fungal lipase-like domain n=1 Tax=Dillenia turbinata TaxID=194707 RepID=A0AAN8YYQ9_9MAGN